MRIGTPLAAITLACVASLGAQGAATAADNYPSRPVRWIVPYTPAGTTDITARIMADWLTHRLGQQVVVDNRPGAGNNIGTEMAIRSAPDGYTVFLVNPANAINATLYQKLSFNFLRDMDPVGGIMRVPNVMETPVSFPAKTVKEFIDYAKANPGKVNMASSGAGTSVHLSGEMFKAMTGVQMQHIPYKGSGPALIDLIAGQVQVLFDNMPSSIGYIKGGKLRALGVTTAKRSPALPDVPTVAETVPGYEASAWFGMSAPKGTPREIVARLNKEINAGLADAGIRAKLADLGGVTIPGTPEDFWKTHTMETEKWAKVVKFSGAKAE
ncbi:MAG TPA: tripartite tricarboxylate transporter substrate binding protein [Burkholderiales bacterium]|nr:tripartite tricarboxylate transporter substrate binding protein [Burkholderiales bacterium]